MTLLRLIVRNLLYFRGVNLAVIAGVAAATAVLSGALMVGDSVRASLRELAVQRLGPIDQALLSTRFFEASLAQRLSPGSAPGTDPEQIVPAVIVRGGAAADSGSAHAAGVQVIGAAGPWAPLPGECWLNGETAQALGLHARGADVVFSIPTEADVPRDATLAKRSRADTLSGLRAGVSQIVTEPGMISLFTPAGGQRVPRNAWVNLADLQDAVGQPGRVNTLLVHGGDVAALNARLRRVVRLSDFGLSIAPAAGRAEAVLTSRSTYLDPPIESAAAATAEKLHLPLRSVSVNLLNAVTKLPAAGRPAAVIHYAVAAGVTPLQGGALAPDEIALNESTARELAAQVGDRIGFTYFDRRSDGNVAETNTDTRGFPSGLRLARILPLSGDGADPSFTPAYKGLTDARSVADWNPPSDIHIDKKLVTRADEDYWRKYKAAPKVFVSFETARKLWGTAFGDSTSVRIPASASAAFAAELVQRIDPASVGLVFRPLRQEQLAASSGSTDFGELFVSFSFFLIAAAALLVAMLMRLSIEQRARQLGVLSSLGFAPKTLRRAALGEGMLLSGIGGVIGSFAAVGYTALMMAGLRTWWSGAVGTTAMHLHVAPLTLAIGFVSSEIVALLAILWGVWQVGRAAPARLLAGGWEAVRPARSGTGRMLQWAGSAGIVCGLLLVGAGALGLMGRQEAFLTGGAMLLSFALVWLGGMLRPTRLRSMKAVAITSLGQLGLRNAARHTGRSVLCIGLIALAAFALVTVSAMRRGEPNDTGDLRSGAGGFRLIVESGIPLLGDPGTVAGRKLLGFRSPHDPLWDRVQFISMRRRAGQDVSCLNLTQPTTPTLLGVPPALVERRAFTFASSPRGVSNPWRVLETPISSGDIPVIADDATAQYILHIAPGDSVDITDAAGLPRHLRLVATLASSIFQSELLMSEDNLRKLFPGQAGFGAVLVQTAPADEDRVRVLLGNELDEYAVTVQTTASRLAGYLEVQNTYLSTFEVLGALGLMLGTIGLGVVLIRTVIERKAELALMASLGFRTGQRVWLILAENAFLLLSGLLLGTACALVGVLPALIASARGINFTSLGLTLIGAMLTGLAASVIAVLLGGRRVTPADLRAE